MDIDVTPTSPPPLPRSDTSRNAHGGYWIAARSSQST
jgi:hypothetical protein